MKNTVTITLDDKKVQALKMYLSEKKTLLDEQLSNYAEQLYGKVSTFAKAFDARRPCRAGAFATRHPVVQNVRDFIDMTAKQQSADKPKKAVAKLTNQP